MRKSIYKIAAYTTASMITLSGFSLNVQAASLTDVLPSAGISYTLGSNSTALSDLQQSSTSNTQTTAAKNETAATAQTASSVAAVPTVADTTSQLSVGFVPASLDNGVLGESRNDLAESDTSVIKTVADTAADTTDADTEEITEGEVRTATNKVIQDTVIISKGYTDDLKEALGSASDDEEESFKNLVIAQVTNYVNVRDLPSEEGEIVGKLYNNSVGNFIE